MVDCLAATGADASLPLVIAAVLVLAGTGIAAIAFRRGRAGAALLVGLVLVLAPLTIGGPTWAHAADTCAPVEQGPAAALPDPSATEPACTPATAIADVSIATGDWANQNGRWVSAWKSASDYIALMTATQQVSQLDPSAQPRTVDLVALNGAGAALITVPISETEDALTSDAGVSLDADVFGSATTGSPRSLAVQAILEYSDRCGGALTTTLTLTGTVPTRSPSEPFPF